MRADYKLPNVPTKSDRVKVEYEAKYVRGEPDGSHLVEVDMPNCKAFWSSIPPSAKITVLPKPHKVGDRITVADPEPPIGTVVRDSKESIVLERRPDGLWYLTGCEASHHWSGYDLGTNYSFIILALPE